MVGALQFLISYQEGLEVELFFVETDVQEEDVLYYPRESKRRSRQAR